MSKGHYTNDKNLICEIKCAKCGGKGYISAMVTYREDYQLIFFCYSINCVSHKEINISGNGYEN